MMLVFTEKKCSNLKRNIVKIRSETITVDKNLLDCSHDYTSHGYNCETKLKWIKTDKNRKKS